jgi:protein-S-isoprenylcysteine O-methyltransferase Ste14
MHALRIAIAITWGVFWIYWLLSAFGAKESIAGRRRIPLSGAPVAAAFVIVRVFHGGSLAVSSPVLGVIGAAMFASGLIVAVWARIHLGRNWGMPMTQRAEPELVTSGPYRFVRHPIYSGLLLGLVGTALATDPLGLILAVLLGAYFYYSASVEERNLLATIPRAYPPYRTATKMLIPFVL